MIPYPLIIGLSFVVIYVVYQSIKSLRTEKVVKKEKTIATSPDAKTEDKKSKPKKEKKSHWFATTLWLIVIILIVIGAWIHTDRKEVQFNALLKSEVDAAKRVTATKRYVVSWECMPGEMFDGMTESGPMRSDIVEKTETSVWINVHYEEYGSPEIAQIYLAWSHGKVWMGTFSQTNPPRKGTMKLKLVGEEHWEGTMFSRDQDFFYTIEMIK